jgi:GNAT superfamily N-acetyltransferase
MPSYQIKDEVTGKEFLFESDTDITDFDPFIEKARKQVQFEAEREGIAKERTSVGRERLRAVMGGPAEWGKQSVAGLAGVGTAGWQAVKGIAELEAPASPWSGERQRLRRTYPDLVPQENTLAAYAEDMLGQLDIVKNANQLPDDEQSILGKVLRTSIESIPAYAAGPAGIAGVAIASGAQVTLSSYREDKQSLLAQGFSEQDAREIAGKSALWKGMITTITTKLGGTTGTERVLKSLGGAGKLTVASVKDFLRKELPKEMLSEYTEEAIDEGAQAIVDKASINPDLTWRDIASRAHEAGGLGALMAASMAGPAYVSERRAHAQELRQEKEAADRDRQAIESLWHPGTAQGGNLEAQKAVESVDSPWSGFARETMRVDQEIDRARKKRDQERESLLQPASPANLLAIAADLAPRVQDPTRAAQLRKLMAARDAEGIAQMLDLVVDPETQEMPDRFRHVPPASERANLPPSAAERGLLEAPGEVVTDEQNPADVLTHGSPVDLAIARGKFERERAASRPVLDEAGIFNLARQRIDARPEGIEATILKRLIQRRDVAAMSDLLQVQLGVQVPMAQEGGPPEAKLEVEDLPDGYRVSGLSVPPEHRGKGIGSRALQGIIDRSEETGKPIYLTADAEPGRQEDLNRFYLRHGFRQFSADPLTGKPMMRRDPTSRVVKLPAQTAAGRIGPTQPPPPTPPPPTVTKLPAKPAAAPVGPKKPAAPAPPTEAPGVTYNRSYRIAGWVVDRLNQGKKWTNAELFQVADHQFLGTQAQGVYTPKDAYDAQEMGINLYISRNLLNLGTEADPEAVQQDVRFLKQLTDLPPTQTRRTGEPQEFKQFSTPPPLAMVVNWVGNTRPGEVVIEPSAGVGGIALFAHLSGGNVTINELSERRRALLPYLPWRGTIHGVNAEQINITFPQDIRPTLILMNPPFSATAERIPGHRDSRIGATHILSALERLEIGGRLVAIAGEGMALDRPLFKKWWEGIRQKYTVRAHIGISGNEYRKYGTTFGNQIIVIDKTGPTTETPIAGQVEKIEDLIPLLNDVRSDRPTSPATAAQQEGAVVPSGQRNPPGLREPLAGPGDLGNVGNAPGGPTGTGEMGGHGGGPGTAGTHGAGAEPPVADESGGLVQPEPRPGAAEPAGGTEQPEAPGGNAPRSPRRRPQRPPSGTPPADALNNLSAEDQAAYQKTLDDLRAALGGASSIGPKFFEIGAKLAYFHLKAGVRSFKRFVEGVRSQVADIWDKLKPYLHGFWTSASVEFPDAEELTRSQAAAIIASVEAPEPAPAPEPPTQIESEVVSQHPDPIITPPQYTLKVVVPDADTLVEKQAIFDQYSPSIPVNGGKPHVTALCESSVMSAVPYPKVTYQHSVPQHLIDSGEISHAQMEPVVLAGHSFTMLNPDGSRRGFYVGDGCVAGETLIYDPVKNTHTAIRSLAEDGNPIQVLSLTDGGFRVAAANAPFRKGIADLFRVTLDDGRSVLVTDNHRFLTPTGWTKIADGLRPGQLLKCGASRPPSIADSAQSIHRPGDWSCSRTATDFLDHCSDDSRRDGARLRQDAGSGQAWTPSPADEHGHILPWFDGDDPELSAKGIHICPPAFRRARSSFSPLGNRGLSLISTPTDASTSESLAEQPQAVGPFPVGCALLQHSAFGVPGTSPDCTWLAADSLRSPGQVVERSQPQPGVWHRIVSIRFERRDEYYDMYVPGPENYLAHGIVHHNTGTGKTRTLAGILLDQWGKGVQRKALWLSDSHGLAEQAMNSDLEPLGIAPSEVHTMIKRPKHKEPEISLDMDIPFQSGILFTAYSHLGSPARKSKGAIKQNRTEQLIKWLGKDFDGVIICDECHNIRNSEDSISDEKRGANRAKETLRIIHSFPKAPVVFASATGMSELQNVAYLGRLGLWGDRTPFADLDAFRDSIRRAGTSGLEKLAADMKAMGLYCSRGLDMRGVGYDQVVVPLHPNQRQMYDQIANAWSRVIQSYEQGVQNGKMSPLMRMNLNATLWGAHQRCMNDLITSFKVPELVAKIEEDIAQGRSAVVQLTFTGAAAEGRDVNDALANRQDLADIRTNPTEALLEYIRQEFPVKAYHQGLDPLTGKIGWMPTMGIVDGRQVHMDDPELVRERDALRGDIGKIATPESLFNQLEKAFGWKSVAEVTGRNHRLETTGTKNGKRVVEWKARTHRDRDMDVEVFQEGDKRILVFSAAGATGRNYHSDLRARNQQQRVHYLLQPGWQAIQVVQGVGRSNRSNQRTPPFVYVMATDMPGELRFMSTIAKRMDELGALTRGHRKASGDIFGDELNLESEYAISALQVTWQKMLAQQIEGVDPNAVSMAMGFAQRPPTRIEMKRFLNRSLNLPIDTQNALYKELTQTTARIIQEAKERGMYSTGLRQLEYEKAEILNDQVMFRHPTTGATTGLTQINMVRQHFYRAWLPGTKPGEFVVGYVRNTSSGRVYGYEQAYQSISSDQRQTMLKRPLQSTRTESTVEEAEFQDEDVYEKISTEQAKRLWEAELAKAPKTFNEQVTMLTGVLLPVWNRIPGSVSSQMYRIDLPDGRRILGRLVPPEAIQSVATSFGVTAKLTGTLTPRDVFDGVLNRSQVIILTNQQQLVKRRVSNDERIEVLHATPGGIRQLVRWGGIMKVIGFSERVFIPTDPVRGLPIIERMLQSNPVSGVIDPNANASVSPEGPRIRGKHSEAEVKAIADKEGAKNVQFIRDGTRRNGQFVVEAETLETTGEIVINLAFMPDTREGIASIIREEIAHQWLNSAEGRGRVDDWMVKHFSEEQLQALKAQGYAQRTGETGHQFRRRMAEEYVAKQNRQQTGWWRNLVDCVRRFLAAKGIVKLSADEAARAILRTFKHRQRFTPETRDALDHDDATRRTTANQGRTMLDPVSPQEERIGVQNLVVNTDLDTTKLHGVEQSIEGRVGGEGTFAQAQDFTTGMLLQLKLPYFEDNLDVMPSRPLTPTEAERLLDATKHAILQARGNKVLSIGRLLNYTVECSKRSVRGRSNPLSDDLRNQLFACAQAERSLMGLRLAELRSTGEFMQRLADNWNTELTLAQAQQFMKPEMQAIIEEAQRKAREGIDLRAALNDPKLLKLIQDIFYQRGMPFSPDSFRTWLLRSWGRHWTSRESLIQNISAALASEFKLPTGVADGAAQALADGIMPYYRDSLLSALHRRRTGSKPWPIVIQAIRDGKTSVAEILDDMAAAAGWRKPTETEIASIEADLTEWNNLSRLSDPEVAAAVAGIPEADVEGRRIALNRARDRKVASTDGQRNMLTTQVHGVWSRWTRPMGRKTKAQRHAVHEAGISFASANLLTTLSFFTRQPIDVGTQLASTQLFRPLAGAAVQMIDASRHGRGLDVSQTVLGELIQSQRDALGNLGMSLRDFKQGFLLRGTTRETAGGFDNDMALFSRWNNTANEAWQSGNYAKASLFYFLTSVHVSLRYAAALDEMSKTLARRPEFRRLLTEQLRLQGLSAQEAQDKSATLLRDVFARRAMAEAETRMRYAASGVKPSEQQILSSADDLLEQYAREELMSHGVPSASIKQIEEMLQRKAWNLEEKGGPGGTVARMLKPIREWPLVGLAGLYSNAIGIGINRMLMYSPLGFFPGVFDDKRPGGGQSGWYATPTDVAERRMEAAFGTSVLAMAIPLIYYGLMSVVLRGPKDREEREAWLAQGHQPFSAEFHYGNGKFLRLGLGSGPLSLVKYPLIGIGAFMDMLTASERETEKLERAGAAIGEPRGAFDIIANRTGAFIGTMIAAGGTGRTTHGLINTFINQYTGVFETRNTVGSLGGYIPYVPLGRGIDRGANLYTDKQIANYRLEALEVAMLPLPDYMPGVSDVLKKTTGRPSAQDVAPSMNLFGEPLTPGGLQHFADSVTGNLLGFGTTEPKDRAWAVLAKAKYYPTPLRINDAVFWSDERKAPMKETDYIVFRRAYGQRLKSLLADVSETDLEQPADGIADMVKALDAVAELETLDALGYAK